MIVVKLAIFKKARGKTQAQQQHLEVEVAPQAFIDASTTALDASTTASFNHDVSRDTAATIV
eukprot:6260217-Pyramimonas_sp.AAC.1